MSNFLELTYEPLNLDRINDLVSSPDCGAISIFIGTTRNKTGDKTVVRLEYEAYTSMALKEMKKICDGIREKWPQVKHIAIFHRLGPVDVEQKDIVIAVSSPHRRESLEAVGFCIDSVKQFVPIWKKVLDDENAMMIRAMFGSKIASALIQQKMKDDKTTND